MAKRKDSVSYQGMHSRLKADLGRAADHPCVDCGEQAKHWAYKHGGNGNRQYSLDVADYEPRCVSCHWNLDKTRAVCSIPGCEREVKGRGWCPVHYARWFRIGSVDLPGPRGCETSGCENKHYAKGFCRKHYVQMKRSERDY